MKVEKDKKAIIIDGRRVLLDQDPAAIVVVGEIVIVELNVDDFEVGDPLVGQNVVAFDKAGEQIWRIEPTGRTRPRQDGSRAPEAFFNLYHNRERGIVTLTTPDGWRWDLDVNTGERSRPRFVK